MTVPGIDVVIVSYRSKELLDRCLGSLRQHPPSGPITVTVVDNDSGDGTPEHLRRNHPWVRVLPQGENVGFGIATNLGAAGGSSPYLLALNPDAAVEAGTLDTLIDLCERDPSIGCAGPELVQEDGTIDHAGRRSFPTPLSALGHFTGVGRRMSSGPLAAYRAPEVASGEVDAVNGAFMLMRREAFEAVGGFDENYWMYMEDLDLNYRLGLAGWKTWYEPAVRAVHTKGGTTGGRRSARLTIAFHDGMRRFYRTHYAPDHGRAYNALIYTGIGAKLTLSLLRGAVSRGARG